VLCLALCASFLPTSAFARSEALDDLHDEDEESEAPLVPWIPDASNLSPSDGASASGDATTGIAKRKRRPHTKKARKRIRKRRHAA
jgi:hypothetical protein